MGYTTHTYHFYGIQIPRSQWTEDHAWSEGERLDAVINDSGVGDKSASVTWMSAGRYDQHMLFLCIHVNGLSAEVEPGEYRTVKPRSLLPIDEWNMALRIVAANAGYVTHELSTAAWITVPSVN